MLEIVAEQSLRDRKKRKTRAALRKSAVELVKQYGLGGVTVEAIAARAELSPRTFFNYFPSKDDVLSGLDPELACDMIVALRDRPLRETPAVALRAALIEVFGRPSLDHQDLLDRLEIIESYPNLRAHQVAAWAELEQQLMEPLIERGAIELMPHWYLSLVVATTIVAARLAVMSWCKGAGRSSLVQEVASHLDVLAAGLEMPTEELR